MVSFTVVVNFQNCAPSQQEENVFSSVDEATTIDQIHRDSDHGMEIPVQEKMALEVSTSLMDRSMVYSVFTDIFGSDSAGLSALNRLRTERAVFGGPCSLYENFKSMRTASGGVPRADSESENCVNQDSAAHLAAPVNPVGNVLQQAMINDVCQQVMANAKAYNYIKAQLKEKPEVVIPENSIENVLKLFRLFYRGKPDPETSLLVSLQTLIGQPATDAGWKMAISTTCVSSHWQAL